MSRETDNEIGRGDLKIQGNLPIRAVGIETQRERNHYTYLPPQNYIHVWWARRPTPVSRLGILASVLPDTVSDDQLLRWMQLNPSNKSDEHSVAQHVRQKEATVDDVDIPVYEHYGYRKIWTNTPDESTLKDIHDLTREYWDGELPNILDATAGGGSIPFESIRYGFPTIANELNPVASVILKSVLEHPRVDGDLSDDIREWGQKINEKVRDELSEFFPSDRAEQINEYLWTNNITCPDCGLELPLSPNWWLDKKSGNEGIAANPEVEAGEVSFSIVKLPNDVEKSEFNPTKGTVSRGKATCLNCSVTIEGDELKRQAEDGEMSKQIYAIHYKSNKKGEGSNFRTPNESDIEAIEKARKEAERDIDVSTLLTEDIPFGEETTRLHPFGINEWRDLYTSRQLLTHYTYWKIYERIKNDIISKYSEDKAEVILTFLSIAADKAIDYNCRLSVWDNSVPKLAHVFSRHDFAFAWSFAESNLLAEDMGYDWVLENTLKAYDDLKDLSGSSDSPTTVLQENAASLSLEDQSIQAIVLDPPYYDNVMYAELSDFFYVWLKKYLGDVYPEFFDTELTPKEDEAVANPSQFADIAGDKQSKNDLAKSDYERKMTYIFEEMYRVLDDDGVFTLMFTHKKTEAWDTLTKALIESGFVVTSTHPVSTESRLSLHQAGKNAAESTILLASEKRVGIDKSPTLWSEIKEQTQRVARDKARELDRREIDFAKVDIILASFGPTLEVFTRNYPVIDDEGDEVRPQVALDEARAAVRDYLIDQYLNQGVREVDSITEWYVLAWLVFEAQRFPYDEANRLGKGVGVEVDDIKRSQRLWRKKGNDIVLRPHDQRVQTPADKQKSRTTKPIDPDAITFDTDLDKVHATMFVYDSLGLVETEKYVKDRGFDTDPAFRATFEALLKVLPPNHDDWEILRDMALTDIGDLVDLDVDKKTFQRAETDSDQQDRLSSYQ